MSVYEDIGRSVVKFVVLVAGLLLGNIIAHKLGWIPPGCP